MFKFKEGARVRVRHSLAELGLDTNMTGIVWALYETEPNSYEVKFTNREGGSFDILLSEPELAAAFGAARKTRSPMRNVAKSTHGVHSSIGTKRSSTGRRG